MSDPLIAKFSAGLIQSISRRRLRRMTPEARATYERIRKLRDEIGPIDFDTVEALREIRDDE